METNRIEIKPFTASIIAIIFLEYMAAFLAVKNIAPRIVIIGLIRLIEIAAILGIFILWGKGLHAVGLAENQWIEGLRKGLIWSAGFGIVALLAGGILYIAGHEPLKWFRGKAANSAQEIVFLYIVGGVIAPVAEELFFRGVLYGFLRRWGKWIAIIFSTLFFVYLHPVNIPVTQFVGGLVFAISYELEGKLLTPITIHILGNMSLFTLTMLP